VLSEDYEDIEQSPEKVSKVRETVLRRHGQNYHAG